MTTKSDFEAWLRSYGITPAYTIDGEFSGFGLALAWSLWKNKVDRLTRELAACENHNDMLIGRLKVAEGAAEQPTSKPVARDDATDQFIADLEAELRRARAKFPGDRIMLIALAEEFGELAKALLDEPGEHVWKEAVQTAVMAARVAVDGDGSVDGWRTENGLDNHRWKQGGQS